jgi:hypothetical protein
MKDQSDHVICAVATANGFAMPYRAAADKKEPKPRRKEALPRAANGLPAADASRHGGSQRLIVTLRLSACRWPAPRPKTGPATDWR